MYSLSRTESVVCSHNNLILNETYCVIGGIGLLPFENMFPFGSDFVAYVDVSFNFARARKKSVSFAKFILL